MVDVFADTTVRINIVTSSVAILFSPFGSYFLIRCFARNHISLRFISYLLALIFVLMPSTNFICDLFIARMGYTAAIVDQTYIYIKMVFSSTMYFPRLICTCFCCERILATIFVERYEKSREFFRYTVLIFMLLVPVAIFQTISYNILRIPVNIIYAFSITVTTTNAVAVHLLYRINKKHRKNRAALQLTHKFQIEENIRVLNLFYYQMVLEVFFGYLAIGSAIFIDKCFNNLTALNVVYFTMYNFYVICVSLYWITRNQAIRASLYHSFTGKRLPVDSNVVEHKNGERHFNDLRNAWK